jgi:hypothetical protein
MILQFAERATDKEGGVVSSNEVVDPQGGMWVGCLNPRFNVEYDAWPLMEATIRAYRAEKGLPDVPIDPNGLSPLMTLGDGLQESDRVPIGARCASELEEDLGSVGGPLRVRIAPRPPNISIEGSGVAVCGPGAPDLATLYGLAFTGAEQLTVWAGFALGLHEIVKRLRERSGQPVYLDTGSAIFVAADAIQRETGENDLTLAFSTEVNAGSDNTGWRPLGGFAVGFRDRSSVRIALMDPCGENVVVRLLPMPLASGSQPG